MSRLSRRRRKLLSLIRRKWTDPSPKLQARVLVWLQEFNQVERQINARRVGNTEGTES